MKNWGGKKKKDFFNNIWKILSLRLPDRMLTSVKLHQQAWKYIDLSEVSGLRNQERRK